MAAAREMVAATARAVGCDPALVLVASTGVIGMRLDVPKVVRGVEEAARRLARDGHRAAAEAIMTTDRGPKERAVRVTTPAGTFSIGGMVKGAGMIEPLMATMLGFLTTDAGLDPALLRPRASSKRRTIPSMQSPSTASRRPTTRSSCSPAARSGVSIDAALYPVFVEALRGLCADLGEGHRPRRGGSHAPGRGAG